MILLIMATVATTANAQKGHYFHANVGVGLHRLDYDLDCSNYEKSPHLGFTGELGWQWFFTNHFGLGLGANFKTLGTTCKLAHTQNTDNLTDKDNGLTYTENVVFNNLEESDKMCVADIPLSLYFQTSLSKRWRLLAGINGFYTLVLSQKYECNSGNLAVSKYFPDYDLEYSGLEDKEHGVYSASGFSGDMKLKKSTYGAGLQLQACRAIGEKRKLELTFGIYGLYRFPDQRDSYVGKIFNAETETYKGITQSGMVGKVTSTNFGGTVGIRYHIDIKEKPMPRKVSLPKYLAPGQFQWWY